MKSETFIQGLMLAVLLAATSAARADVLICRDLDDPAAETDVLPAEVPTALPMPVKIGDAAYVTGGIGDDELAAMKASAHEYNLQIISAGVGGAYTADVDVSISKTGGGEVLRATTQGPLFYANLPAGRYIIAASRGDQKEVRHVEIGKKPVVIHMVWKGLD